MHIITESLSLQSKDKTFPQLQLILSVFYIPLFYFIMIMTKTIEDYLGIKDRDIKKINTSFKKQYGFSTNYATHNIYPYPAKFIPHVVRFFLVNYTSPGEIVFDPFAGSGTVAMESSILGRNWIVYDLNPLIEILVKASTWDNEFPDLKVDFNYTKTFTPDWKNLYYWHPKEFVEILSRLWGYYHDNPNPLLAIILMKISKNFSYTDPDFIKPYKSKFAIERVNHLLSQNYKKIMEKMFNEEMERLKEKINEYKRLAKKVEGKVRGGIDIMSAEIPNADAVITSPPYLQAQEYIRTFLIELHWLGYNDKQIRELEKNEIPYNRTEKTKMNSETYEKYLEAVKTFNKEELIKIYETYFSSLAKVFEKIKAEKIGLFVAPVKIRSVRIPIDDILREHLESIGWKWDKTFIDIIASRRIKEVKVNPATNLQDERTPTEHLLVMRK